MQNKKDLNDLYQLFIVIQQNALSGISIPDALTMYEETTTRPKIKRILKTINNRKTLLPKSFYENLSLRFE